MGSGYPSPSPQSTTAPLKKSKRNVDRNPHPCTFCKEKKLGCKSSPEEGDCDTCKARGIECKCCDRCKKNKVVCVVDRKTTMVVLSAVNFENITGKRKRSTEGPAPFIQTIQSTPANRDRRPVKRQSTDATLVNEEVPKLAGLFEDKFHLDSKSIHQGTFQTYPTKTDTYTPPVVASPLVQPTAPIRNATTSGGWTSGAGATGSILLNPRFITWSLNVMDVLECTYEIDGVFLKFEKAGDICTITLIAKINGTKSQPIRDYETLPEISIPQTAWQWIMECAGRAYRWDLSNPSRNHLIERPSSKADQGPDYAPMEVSPSPACGSALWLDAPVQCSPDQYPKMEIPVQQESLLVDDLNSYSTPFFPNDDVPKRYYTNSESVSGAQWTDGPIFDSPGSTYSSTLPDEPEGFVDVGADYQTPQYPNRAVDEILPQSFYETAQEFSGQSYQTMPPAAQESLVYSAIQDYVFPGWPLSH